MKFKTDKASIAEIARSHTESELTATLWLLESIWKSSLSDGLHLDSNINTLRKAIKLKTEAAVYAFWKRDWLWEAMWERSIEEYEWISLFRRYWDRLQHILWSEIPSQFEDSIRFMKKNNIKKIITWPLLSDFCSVKPSFDVEYGWERCFIEYRGLTELECAEFRAEWIDIEALDELI